MTKCVSSSDEMTQRSFLAISPHSRSLIRNYVILTFCISRYSVIYRLEDVYLMLAESLMKQNKTAQAVPFINYTRQRAGLTALTTSISQSQAMEEIKNERRKEFFAEHGNRFLDLKRWGQLDQLKPVKVNWKATNQFFPLPQKEMLLNMNLTPQNDGY